DTGHLPTSQDCLHSWMLPAQGGKFPNRCNAEHVSSVEIRKSFVLIRTARILGAKPAGPAYVCRVRVDRPAEGVTAEERQAIRITLLNGELKGVVPRIAVATRHVEGSEVRIGPTLLSVGRSGRAGDVHCQICVRTILEANPARANVACA